MGPASTSDEGRMPKTGPVVVLGLVVGSTGIPATTFARSEGLRLRIELRNDAKFRRNAIEAAQTLVSGIYAHTGVHLIWTTGILSSPLFSNPSASDEITLRSRMPWGLRPAPTMSAAGLRSC